MLAPRPVTTVTTLALAAAVLLTATACSSGSDGQPVAGPTVTVTETATATVTGTPTSSPNASASASSNPGPECGTGDLKAKVRDLESGAGQRYAAVVLTNTGRRTCDVRGYPGLQLLAAGGGKVPTKVVRVSDPAPTTVKVAPGRSAAATISFSVIPSGSEPDDGPCQPDPSSLLVTPPDATTSLTTGWELGSVCSGGRIGTNAFVAGNGG